MLQQQGNPGCMTLLSAEGLADSAVACRVDLPGLQNSKGFVHVQELNGAALHQLHVAKWALDAGGAAAGGALPWPEAMMTSAAQAYSKQVAAAAEAMQAITSQV